MAHFEHSAVNDFSLSLSRNSDVTKWIVVSTEPIDSKQLAELSTFKFQSFIKVLISTICAQPLRQTSETCCKERDHLKMNKRKVLGEI